MRNIKIVADSSANVLTLETMAFAAAPLKIITNEKEFADDAALDVAGMVQWFDGYKGKSKTSCPNPSDWLEALKNFAANGRVSGCGEDRRRFGYSYRRQSQRSGDAGTNQ